MLSINEGSNNNTRLDSLLNTRLDEDEVYFFSLILILFFKEFYGSV